MRAGEQTPEATGGRWRFVLVEDHPIVRLGLKTVLDAQDDMIVAGEAATAAEAVQLTRSLRPDLVIMALRLEGELRGIEICREIKSLPQAPRVLVYTSFNSHEDVSSSFLSGADSFVYKRAEPARLLTSVRETLQGNRAWLTGAETGEQSSRLRRQLADSGLTPREREVLGFMLQHYTNSSIAHELYIELPTVKTHVSSILRKLGLSSRRELF